MLPIARTGAPAWPQGGAVPTWGPVIDGGAPLSVALFSATSASCVTGLIVVDTATYWTPFGQAVLLALMEIGGLGTMTVAAFVARIVRHRLSLRTRWDTAVAASAPGIGDLNRILSLTVTIAVTTQLVAATVLAVRFMVAYGYSFERAVWHAVFHAGSAYNNAGFALHTDSLAGFVHDPCVLITLALLIIIGGLGFPVIIELLGTHRLRSLHARMVVGVTAVALGVGTVFMAVCEWNNRATLANLNVVDKWVNAFFTAVSPRTAGFNSLDIAHMHPSTWFGTDILMLIGAGPASTGGGLKVTTVGVVAAITWAQVCGRDRVHVGRWRVSDHVQGQVVTLVGLASALIVGATMALMALTPYGLDRCLFEVISAFATVGLTTGITPQLPVAAQAVLVALMIIGRIGPFTLAAALSMRRQPLLYDRPVDNVLVG
ncbi:TrkH family potassium uptake protein [Nanchangia anserum]|uniref:TrkH family potassium uptake protein n=2 Tax=Nanchangia anserum TaxID=2692125 RepID=A0A8I0KPZ9_9ACTO|nr:potassium transporter TrkG [Nanchangia anserum]MBD3689435.1 TrkH family potassium uptake protein [Nanchangia anserum]QOX82653.1 TrkH family potassium uptake protein [Nanchangia anserum]